VSESLVHLRSRVEAAYGPTTANLGPRYLHSTGQLHKGGPTGAVGVQIVQRPTSTPLRIKGRRYSFHDLHMAQAQSDLRAMRRAQRQVWQLVVDDLDEAAVILGLQA
jgi:transaldolase/glucose-6-phosphate isomerase